MSMTEGQRLIARGQDAFNTTERRNAEADWKELLELVLCNQNMEVSTQGVESSKGDSRTTKLKDSTAARANHELSSTLFSTMTPPTAKWCKFRHKNKALNNNSNVSRWMDELANTLHYEFAESNFYAQVGKSFPFFTGLGTMSLLHEEKTPNPDGSYSGVRFTSMHIAQVAWEENAEGIADSSFRRFELSPIQIIEQFDNIPAHITIAAEQTPNDKFVVWHCIDPREPYVRSSSGLVAGKDKKYGSYFIDESTGTILKEEGFSEFPIYIPRMDTMPGEVCGRGLGHLALPDIRQLQYLIKKRNLSMDMAVDPPSFTQAGCVMSNIVDMRPGHNTILQRLDGLKWFESTARFDVAQLGLDELRKSIQSTFMIDKLLLPPRTDTGEMSAFEVSQRIEQTQRVLGSVPNRLIAEFLQPLILRQVKIMDRRGALPPRPAELEGDSLDVEIVYVNQLSRAQNIEEVTALQQWIQFNSGLAQLKPEVIDTIDADEVSRHVGRTLGVPETAIAGDKEIADIRDQRQQQQQAQMQADLNLKQADAQSKQQ